jgi:alpha-glucosidase
MAEATRAGFLAARPDERPFLLSRSAFISSSRHTAVWTGDNFSNWHHLRMAIPVTLGLALSGLPFNGADVGGFALNTTRELIVAWYKAGFLFPFFRNHNASPDFVRAQEPWTFGPSAERIMARYVRLRYKFLPYLYQLFVAQEQTGEAVVRPLFYDFPDRRTQPLGKIEDQFMAGPSLLHAPIVDEGKTKRAVLLPAGGRWYSLAGGTWIPGGQTVEVRAPEDTTPLFAREGSLVALRPGQSAEHETDLREIELHVFLTPGSRREAVTEYSADDGLSYAYRRGKRTTVRFRARLTRTGTLAVTAGPLSSGFGPLRVRLVSYAGAGAFTLTSPAASTTRLLQPFAWQATGRKLSAHASAWLEL